jgi:ATP-dependent DNA helicase RecG
MVTLKINPRAKEMAARITPEKAEKSTQKSTQKLLDIIGQNSFVTRAELAKEIGLSEGGVKKQLKKLQAKGVLKRVGPDKGGHWEVLE